MSKSILFDQTRCIGCRSCEEACKDNNIIEDSDKKERLWSKDKYGDFRKPPEGLSGDKWLHMSYHARPDKKEHGQFEWDDIPGDVEDDNFMYMRHACMHCTEPACVNACIVGALTRDDDGAVVYDGDKCMGCRYCMIACPFHVPKWEWHRPLPYIRKCTMCRERRAENEIPYCVDSCPVEALTFGERDDLLFEAEKRIREDRDENPDKPNYYPEIFGKDEVGGTGVIYLTRYSDKPYREHFESLTVPGNLGTRAIPKYSAQPMSTVPYWVGGLSAMLGGAYWIINRRNTVPREEAEKGKGGDHE